MSYSLYLVDFLCSLVMEAPVVGSNFIEIFIHACIVYLCLLSFVFTCSTLLKHTVSSYVSISSLHAVFLRNLNSENSFTFVSSFSSIFLSSVSRILYPLIPYFDMNFPDHIRHFPFFPVKGIILIIFSSILYFLIFSCDVFDQSSSLLVLL